nr:polysaccharide deacetylase family protein [Clostridia bacterium]
MIKRISLMALLLAVCLLTSGCELPRDLTITDLTESLIGGDKEWITPSPAPVLNNEPASLLTSVTTDRRAAALVLEGYTDDASMRQLIDLIKERGVPCVWFVSGVTAYEYGDVVRYAVAAGIKLGNYTVAAEKKMETWSSTDIVRQFTRTQELILQHSGVLTDLGRCNGTEYTYEVLQAVAAAGLDAAVEPTMFLNHRSFRQAGDAALYMKSMMRGAVISVKLGQELDAEEYGDSGEKLDERPAVDPSPSIPHDLTMTAAEWTYQNIVPVVTWLLDALKAEGYELLTLEELQATKIDLIGEPRQLTEAEAALVAPDAYVLPVTDGPLLQTAKPLDNWAGTVFIGDSVTKGLADYVAWKRQSDPEYLKDADFLAWQGLTVESALSSMDDAAELPAGAVNLAEKLRELNPKRVYLMLRFDTIKACTQEKYLVNLRLLLHLLKEANPQTEFVVQSVPPGIEGRLGSPDDSKLFSYNLLLAKMCAEYSIPFADVASWLRDDKGHLPMEYCIDPQMYGIHLSDEGCERWLSSLMSEFAEQ